ncbi:hypothetical protein [Lujinxingia litoralis]|uniref:hypothetical protein n=1 Tax=Lujinxingia litoralis TaxID=2211119 RepID=UPI0011B9410B|nr:hypothetical protein [Lujinxingia litoralis]
MIRSWPHFAGMRTALAARVLLAALAAALTWGSSLGVSDAQTLSEDLWVLPTGGTRVLWSYQIRVSPEGAQITRRADVPLQLESGQLASYNALLKLPDGHLLLGDGSGRGALRFDAEGHEVEALASPGDWTSSPGLAVASYLAPNRPAELLMGDNTVGRIHLYDTVEGRYTWSLPLGIAQASARVEATAVLPDNRFAVALRWPAVELSGVLIFERDDRRQPTHVLLSAPHPDYPEAAVLPQLDPIRAFMALPDNELIIASAQALLRVNLNGELSWQSALSDAPVGGEYLALSWLSERYVVASSYQPGLWTSPHPNHRLLIYDTLGAREPLGSSTPLDGAARALDLARGHGGTRTLDYRSPTAGGATSDLSTLTLVDELIITPEQAMPGAPLVASLTVRNDADVPTWVRSFELRNRPGSCPTSDTLSAAQWQQEVRTLRLMEFTLQPGQELLVEGASNTTALFIGFWCAQMIAVDRLGEPRLMGSPAEFEISAGADHTTMEVESLGSFDPWEPQEPGPPTDGSGSQATSGCQLAPSGPGAWPALIGAALFWRRRRRRKGPSVGGENDVRRHAPPGVPSAEPPRRAPLATPRTNAPPPDSRRAHDAGTPPAPSPRRLAPPAPLAPPAGADAARKASHSGSRPTAAPRS